MQNPIEIFDSLDKSQSTIQSLRKAQKEILVTYYENLQERPRLGIKLPTGSGKSLIAILLLETWRRAGKVVAILTANKALAKDMKNKCDEFKIPSATIFGAEGDREYRINRTLNLLNYKQKNIIGIFNYHSFLYGTEYKQEIYPPDILVIDDASDFTIVRNDFFSVIIHRREFPKIYEEMLGSLIEESNLYPHIRSFLNNTSRRQDVELIFFTHYNLIISLLRKYMKNLRKNDTFRFSYDRNKQFINSFLIFISQYEIEFRPLHIPEELLMMGNTKQIIFMSATLPEEELLNKMFGIRKNPVYIIDEKSITSEAFEEITTLGKRLIFPLEKTDLMPGIGIKCKNIILELINIHKKVLVLANSNYDANSLYQFLISQGIDSRLFSTFNYEEFANNMKKGVLICANRYFGLDFPGVTCRVEVIVRLPMIWDNVDAFQYSVLHNNSYFEQTIGYRLTQSFGRCNRLINDEALYYILDSRIISRLTGIPQYLNYLPRNMYAELMTGYLLSEGGIIERAIDYGNNSFFETEDKVYENILEGQIREYKLSDKELFVSKYDLEIEAWEKSINKSYNLSGQLFDFVANYYEENASIVTEQNLGLLAAFNYYLSALNYHLAYINYNDEGDRKKCLLSLHKSIESGGNTSWFNSIRAIYNDLSDVEKLPFEEDRIEIRQIKEQISRDMDDFIYRNTSRNRNWKETYRQLQRDVLEGTHDQALGALTIIFRLMGYSANKGNNVKGEPDIMVESKKYQLAVEIKTKEKGEIESVKGVRQAIGYKGVMERRNPDLKTYAILITQKEDFSPTAIEVAINQVKLIKTSILNIIFDKFYNIIDEWENLSPTQRTSYVDIIISPYEIEDLFLSSRNPILSKENVKEITV